MKASQWPEETRWNMIYQNVENWKGSLGPKKDLVSSPNLEPTINVFLSTTRHQSWTYPTYIWDSHDSQFHSRWIPTSQHLFISYMHHGNQKALAGRTSSTDVENKFNDTGSTLQGLHLLARGQPIT